MILSLVYHSCEQKGEVKNHISSAHEMIGSKEEWTIYSIEDTLVHVKRLMSSDTSMDLLSYTIDIAKPEVSVQSLRGNKKYVNGKAPIIIKTENASFNWVPYKSKPVLFVQIEPSAFKDEMEQYDKKEGLVERIEKALLVSEHVEEVGCDVGPGGLNLLFEVDNIDKAVPVIIKMLKKEGYANKTTIGRRVNINKEDWFYEVIYPATFNGVFLTM